MAAGLHVAVCLRGAGARAVNVHVPREGRELIVAVVGCFVLLCLSGRCPYPGRLLGGLCVG